MALAQCPFCLQIVGDPRDETNFGPFIAHTETCPVEQADALVAANPQWLADPAKLAALRFLHPSGRILGAPSSPGLAAAPSAPTSLFTHDQGSEVLPGVFLTSLHFGKDPDWLRERGVGVVVNCISLQESKPLTPEEVARAGLSRYECLDIDDCARDDYDERLRRGAGVLAEGRREGRRVLVHCAAGVSRSATVLLAYLMLHHRESAAGEAEAAASSAASAGDVAGPVPGAASSSEAPAHPAARGRMSLVDAVSLVKSRRPVAQPNLGFIKWLRALEEEAARGDASSPFPSPSVTTSSSSVTFSPSIPEELLAVHKESIAAAARERARAGRATAGTAAGRVQWP